MKKYKIWLKRAGIILVLIFVGLIARQVYFVVNFGTASDVPVYTPLPSFEPPSDSYALPAVPADSITVFPDVNQYHWALIASGLVEPVGLAFTPDGSGRVFILERVGRIRIFQDGVLVDRPFLDLTDRVGSDFQEQGFLGLVFDPSYYQNGHFYVNYTDQAGNTVLARYTVSADPDVADPSTEHRFFTIKQPYVNHNGGGLAFGPDGLLYAGLGDGGLWGDPEDNAQDLDEYLGKLLVFDPDNLDTPNIYASGLRNPWRFSFDRLKGDLYIADVGQNEYEEVDFLPAGLAPGANFGWDFREGFNPYEEEQPADPDFVDPIVEYDHTQGCSVTGGFVYRGQNLPDWRGVYLYGDYCSGVVWGLLRDENGEWQNQQLFKTNYRIASFGEDQQGEIYLVDLQGNVYRLEAK